MSQPTRPAKQIEALIASELGRSLASPDLTPAIMQRLGYRRVPAPKARWRNIGWCARRVSLSLAAVVAVAVGVYLHDHSPRARRPVGPTIPAALNVELHRQGRQLNDMIQRWRDLTGPTGFNPAGEAVSTPDVPPPRDVDHSAVAPVRWV